MLRVARARPVWRLRVPQLETEAPVVRLEAAELRQAPRQARKGDLGRLAERLLRDEPRREKLGAEGEQVFERAGEPRGRRAVQARPDRPRPLRPPRASPAL